MAETTPTWISCTDPTCYTPQEMRLHDSRLVCSQGVSMQTGGGLVVTKNVGDPLCVDIASGGAWVTADLGGDCQGVYGVHNCGITTVCADDGDPTDSRIDRVVFQVHDATLGGTLCDSELMIVKGAPSPAPVPPAEPANSITLALITVTAAGITTVSDQRVPFVACGGSRLPTTALHRTTPGSGTFLKAQYPGAAWFEVTMVGGGGGGGGCSSQGSGLATVAGGGSGAAGLRLRVPYAAMPDSVSWTVGQGGAGAGGGGGANGPGTAGADGTRTIFGTWEMGAGRGGAASVSGASTPDIVAAASGGGIVTGTFGEVIESTVGDTSATGMRLSASQFASGMGGDGPLGLGIGGQSRTQASSGLVGSGPGAGGSGAAAANSAGFIGGNGGDGFLRIEAWY